MVVGQSVESQGGSRVLAIQGRPATTGVCKVLDGEQRDESGRCYCCCRKRRENIPGARKENKATIKTENRMQ